MFGWLRARRRRKLTRAPFPAAWDEIIGRNVAHFGLLDDAERVRLRALIQVFIAEKYWEAAGGLELDDEIRVTISAQACLLLLGIPHDYYPNVRSIIVYPSTVIPPERRLGTFEIATEPMEMEQPIDGEAVSHGGPVIIIWDAALHEGRHPEQGYNVIYHEFAHKLDMLDGAADGTPPLRGRAEYREWALVCTREYQRLRRETEAGRRSFLDAYGATDEAEFFAVATEQFFDRPQILIRQAPDLYRVLQAYYRQDPAGRVARGRRISGGGHGAQP